MIFNLYPVNCSNEINHITKIEDQQMKKLSSLLLLFASSTAGVVHAQSVSQKAAEMHTKILGIGTLTAPLSTRELKDIIPNEVNQTVGLYLNGTIEQWWSRQDGKGVVFILDVPSVQQAETLLEKLPLGIAGRMKFDLIPIGPLQPLKFLLNSKKVGEVSKDNEADTTVTGPQ